MADLAELTELRAIFPLTAEATLAAALKRASDAFVGAVGWPVLVHDATVTLHGDGGRTLALPAREVEVASVSIDGAEAVTVGTPDSGLRMDPRLGVLIRDEGWPRGFANVVATYRAGYLAVPPDIADAVLERAQWIAMGGFAQLTAGPFSASTGASRGIGATQAWADTVARYAVGVGDRA